MVEFSNLIGRKVCIIGDGLDSSSGCKMNMFIFFGEKAAGGCKCSCYTYLKKHWHTNKSD